jgi:hypothetical protein
MDTTNLPGLITKSEDIIDGLAKSLDVPRELLPQKNKIENVLNQLPELLSNIREEFRDEQLAKMCIAIEVGLFDSAVNYIWNQTIKEIRKRIIMFGLDVVKQLKGKEYTEDDVDSMQDSQLLDIARELNLIDEEGFYFLSQCRDVRNNFSAAHPAMGNIDNYELVTFINRCVKYSLGQESVSIGVDIKLFINTLNGPSFSEEQLEYWANKIKNTPAQKEAIIIMLFGIYCDPDKQMITRTNTLNLSIHCKEEFTNKIVSSIINCYEEYVGKGDEGRKKAAEVYFVQLEILNSVKDSTHHAIITKACKQMMLIHQGINNFYNEPPFAEYMCLLSSQADIPESAKYEFVNTIISCAIGNEYGVSNGAVKYYDDIIRNFSPREIEIMLKLPDQHSDYTSYKINKYPRCINQYKRKVELLNPQSVPFSLQSLYQKRLST